MTCRKVTLSAYQEQYLKLAAGSGVQNLARAQARAATLAVVPAMTALPHLTHNLQLRHNRQTEGTCKLGPT